MKTLAGVPYCECESPCRQVAEGIEYCGNEDCGHRLVDPALMALAAEVKALRHQVAELDAKAEAPAVPPVPPDAERREAAAPPIAVKREDAAATLGISLASFKRHVAPQLRVIREGGLRLYLVADLEAWADRRAEAPMVEQVAATNGRAA